MQRQHKRVLVEKRLPFFQKAYDNIAMCSSKMGGLWHRTESKALAVEKGVW